MKTKKKQKRIKRIQEKIPKIIYNSLESFGNFIKASMEKKPLLYLFEKAEKQIYKTITRIEKYREKEKAKRKEKKKIKQQIAEHSDRKHIPTEVFFKRMKALKERFPIKNLNQELER